MKRAFLTLALLSILSGFTTAQTIDTGKLNAYFNALEKNNKFMGSVAVSKNGKLIYKRSVGFADVENQVKASSNTKYHIGSITKTFTATLIMKAVELNKLSLDQTIDKYFPGIANSKKITVAQLLNHRSGIYNFTNDAAYLDYYTRPKTKEELLQIISTAGSDFEPGSKHQYSNSNYVLLTFILEKSMAKPYGELLQRYITKPLELNNTHYGGRIDAKKNDAYSYRLASKWKKSPETDSSVPLGAGAIVSTPSDLTRFCDALFAGKVISLKSLEQMKTMNDNYGYGLIPVPFFEKTGFGHGGGIDSFSSIFIHFPADSVSYAMTSNGSNFNNNDISIAVLSAVYGKPFTVPDLLSTGAISLSSEELDKYVGVYSSEQLPIKITVSKDNTTLIAQATGQGSFPLEASAKDVFKFVPAGLVLEFSPADRVMILKQGGGTFKFQKQ